VTWHLLAPGIAVLELDPLPCGLALELQVAEIGGVLYAAWLLDDGRVLRAWVTARA
jgi:hypothetical protein